MNCRERRRPGQCRIIIVRNEPCINFSCGSRLQPRRAAFPTANAPIAMHISRWLIWLSSQIVAASAATQMFNFAMLQIVCNIGRDRRSPGGSLFLLQLGESGENLFAVRRRLYGFENFCNLAVRADDKRIPRRNGLSLVFAERAVER
jgi:hypothetical protein